MFNHAIGPVAFKEDIEADGSGFVEVEGDGLGDAVDLDRDGAVGIKRFEDGIYR